MAATGNTTPLTCEVFGTKKAQTYRVTATGVNTFDIVVPFIQASAFAVSQGTALSAFPIFTAGTQTITQAGVTAGDVVDVIVIGD